MKYQKTRKSREKELNRTEIQIRNARGRQAQATWLCHFHLTEHKSNVDKRGKSDIITDVRESLLPLLTAPCSFNPQSPKQRSSNELEPSRSSITTSNDSSAKDQLFAYKNQTKILKKSRYKIGML